MLLDVLPPVFPARDVHVPPDGEAFRLQRIEYRRSRRTESGRHEPQHEQMMAVPRALGGAPLRIVVDPSNPKRVWVAANGPLFSEGGERGLYRSDNGVQQCFDTNASGV